MSTTGLKKIKDCSALFDLKQQNIRHVRISQNKKKFILANT